jgi:hypothetical protein
VGRIPIQVPVDLPLQVALLSNWVDWPQLLLSNMVTGLNNRKLVKATMLGDEARNCIDICYDLDASLSVYPFRF